MFCVSQASSSPPEEWHTYSTEHSFLIQLISNSGDERMDFFISNSGMGKDGKDGKDKNRKNEKKQMLEINKIMVRKLSYLKNHADLGGQWSNLMVKV